MAGLIILGLLALVVVFIGGISGLFAAVRTRDLSSEIQSLKLRLRQLERKLRGEAQEPEPPIAPKPELRAGTLRPADEQPPPPPPLFAPPPPAKPAVAPSGAAPSPPPPHPIFTPISEPAPAASAPEKDAEWWANFEERVGKRWMTWAGAVVLILSVGFFVKYAIDRAWLNEVARDVIGIGFGALLVGAGARFARKKMTALGQGLMGCGLGILYLSLYAAYGYHGWMPKPVACGALVLVSAAGITLSVVFDALPVSLIAILGGFLTPLMVSTGHDERDLLFAYLLLLDVSVLGVAFFKRWRPLDVLAFVGTAVLFLMWFGKYYCPREFDPAYMWATMSWLGAFFFVFLVLPFAHHMRRKTPITVERFVMALVNATGVCTLAYYLMYDHHQHALGYVVLGMSASYAILGVLCRRLVPEDEKSPFGFLAMAMVFFTISIPLHFGLNGVTLCWAAEAPLLLYLGYKYSYRPVKLGGFAMLFVLLARFFFHGHHWPLHTEPFWLFQNPSFGIAMSVVLSVAAYALVHQWQRKHSRDEDRSLKVFTAVTSGVLALVFINAEVAQYYELSYGVDELAAAPAYFSGAYRAMLWAVGAVVFLVCGLWSRSQVTKVVAFLVLLVAAVAAVGLYGFEAPDEVDALLNLRFAAGLAVVACLFACGGAFTRVRNEDAKESRKAATVMHVIGGFALLLLLSAETFVFAAPDAELDVFSITTVLWALGAAAFMAAGVWWRSTPARASGRVALSVSILSAASLYFLREVDLGSGSSEAWPLFFTEHFAAALAPVVVALAYPLVLFFGKSLGADNERPKVSGLFSRAAVLLLVVLTVEIFAFSGEYGARCAVTLLWLAGSAALFAAALRWSAFAPSVAAVFAVVVSFFMASALYATTLPEGYLLFLNLRFGVCVFGAALLFAVVEFGRRCERGGKLTPAVATIATVLMFLLLSIEPTAYCHRMISDAIRAAWSARMALTIAWSAYAAAMLCVGFWRKNRPLRFAALALFGITGLKLVAVDLAGVRQIYRIISFLVMGLLMIGASCLYHKVEKRLASGPPRSSVP